MITWKLPSFEQAVIVKLDEAASLPLSPDALNQLEDDKEKALEIDPFQKAAGVNESVNVNGKVDERTSLLSDGVPSGAGADAKHSNDDGSDEF